MLKLHGFPVSNYSNMVHLALLEKGVPFEYVLTIPDQSPAVLARSPRGKVPFIETPQGFLNETSAILDYLEERGEGRPLLPAELLGLARFITDYYRCPLGATLATMLPARLLRADSEMVVLTPSGVGADPSGLGAAGAAILSALVAGGSARVPALLAKAGCRDQRPLDELVRLGLVELRRQRRDRPPPAEVAAEIGPQPHQGQLELPGIDRADGGHPQRG